MGFCFSPSSIKSIRSKAPIAAARNRTEILHPQPQMSKKARNYALSSKAKPEIALAAPPIAYAPSQPASPAHRIGMIGCGGITASHLKAYRKAGWKVSAFYDIDHSRASARQKEFYPSARVCKSIDELLAIQEIDVVDIATHPAERVPLIEAALRAGKHVLSQKPFVLDLKDGEKLVALAKSKKLLLAVNQNGRWAPHFSYIRQAAQQGVLGPVGSLTTSVAWDHTWTKGTPFEKIHHLLLYDFAIHWFDFVSQVFAGRRALEVMAYLEKTKGQPMAPPLLGSIAIRFEGGVASLAFHGVCVGGSLDLTTVSGTQATLFCEGPDLSNHKVRFLKQGRSVPVKLKGSWFVEGFQGTMGELLTSIEERRQPNNSAANNLDSLALCFAAIRSAETGKPQVPGKVRRASDGCKPST